ncbi:phosphoribosylanthranilate isomerase [Paenarthrobacter sp. CC6]|jgi:phosphoribosylanthranilate isomerase|uniref:phosphoribosylanthranilate isomerase n=1 Tax=Paenarthrobacter sp. CC6 TaxID=3029184 RepID=UPI00035FE00D|nr:N-(5'phosphoribosyl)anthranilate isomerase [Arthrobacter sp. MWB30]KQR06832.1 phosphoribosylanthranilate isomerase [Arthrobacter sp. Leaf145]SKB78123.1 phosphoribosylanthranilate isomerase [Arthrobacter sp. 31Cvi3.1E]BCW12195.1 N-(5'-phosphoribosyl)anthranilate isomerase [Arthrobacter sp. NtRootA2]BCW16277.1 N-(5'-phosphoribosyl)anthranilate isomerase [Arthrobacter sp. NtRootA4]BCW24609.1 N-(5'-phosphoribosyl)anthranilate isomerase [Arthrobacter sp. NtRootC7]BCW28880.1 N-(5'-phosphoribosyl
MFVKVCGLSTPESVREAVDAGADAVGFVLTTSPREVSPDQVRILLPLVPAGVHAVGVFRHEAAADAVATARASGLSWVQLHGRRTADDVKTVHDAGMRLIRAVTMGASQDEFADLGEDVFLIDAAVPGSGESWDYASVRDKGLESRAWLLAGGLEPGNVAFAAAAAGAWGVDVSSGVESSRGVKDLAKIRAFVTAAKA